jgi:hypothetical protein
MSDFLGDVAGWIAASPLREQTVDLLRTVPGLPPLIQSVHILGVAVLVAAILMPHLRVLGLAAGGQRYPEMIRRLSPWAWTALVVVALSGAVFIIARPYRYFSNPIVGIKFGALAAALVLSVVTVRLALSAAPLFEVRDRLLAGSAVAAWVVVIFGGRWIAYVDYLFWEG